MPRFLKSEKTFLIFLSVFNIVLRTFRLNSPTEPFLNEKYFILPAVRSILEGLGDKMPLTPPSPLGKLIFAASIKIFGDNPFGWRIMPVLFTTASVILIYFLAKEIFKNRIVATTASLLLTFETAIFVHSRSMDPEAIFVTFVLLSLFFSWKLITESKMKWIFYTGISFGLSLAVKPQALLPLIAIGIAVFFFSKSNRLLSFSLIFLLATFVYLAIYAPLLKEKGIAGFFGLHLQMYQYHTNYWPKNYYQVMSQTEYGPRMPQINSYMRYPILWLKNPKLPYFERNISSQKQAVIYTYNPLILFPAIGAFLLGLVFAFKKRDQGIIFLLITASFFYFPYLLSSLYKPLTYPPYYLLSGIPFLIILLSYFTDFIRQKKRFIPIVYLALVAATFVIYYPLLTAMTMPYWYFQLLTGLN